jgi:hypothetical protein
MNAAEPHVTGKGDTATAGRRSSTLELAKSFTTTTRHVHQKLLHAYTRVAETGREMQ